MGDQPANIQRALTTKDKTQTIWNVAIENLTICFAETKGQRISSKLAEESMTVI
jgi:hypothetical protein